MLQREPGDCADGQPVLAGKCFDSPDGGRLEEDNLTQRELAERMGLSEGAVSEGAVSQVLGGDRNLTINKIAAYADAVDRRVVITFHRRDEGIARPPWTSVQTTPGLGGYLEQTQEIRGFSDARS